MGQNGTARVNPNISLFLPVDTKKVVLQTNRIILVDYLLIFLLQSFKNVSCSCKGWYTDSTRRGGGGGGGGRERENVSLFASNVGISAT